MRTDLCGSCELAQRVRGAAQSTTARSSRLAPAGRARQLGGWAPTVCANAQWARAADLGHRDSQTAGQYASTRARSRHIRPSSGALGVRPVSSACLHACIGARSARLHRFGETRALSVPAERHGRTARYGRASGTASGAIGRRLPGQPVAVAQSSWLRRAQQFERASDSRAAWGRPGDGYWRRAPRVARRWEQRGAELAYPRRHEAHHVSSSQL